MSFSFGYEEEGDVTTTADVSTLPLRSQVTRSISEGSRGPRFPQDPGDKLGGVRRLSAWFSSSTKKQKTNVQDVRRPKTKARDALEIEVKECSQEDFASTGLTPPPTPTYALRVRPTPQETKLETAPSPVIASSSFFGSSRRNELDSLISTFTGVQVEPRPAAQYALSLPEIVENIMRRLDDQCFVATSSVNRRAGASRDRKRSVTLNAQGVAVEVDWEAEADRCWGALSACLTVNSVFHDAARRAIARRIELTTIDAFDAYIDTDYAAQNGCRDLLIHKLGPDQDLLEMLQHSRLVSLEFYVCPQLLPTSTLLGAHQTLTKLAVPGCGLVDDAFLSLVAKQCTRLKILDLRACELVSDVGLTKIARACRQLQYLNVGRVGNAHCITDRSVFEIARSTQIETLGVAGCQVGDDGISAISEYRGHAIERLSLNACESITDWSVSKLLLNSPKLQVLELFRCPRVMDATAILNFQRKSQALVEVDDALKAEMQEILRIRALRRRTMPELGGAHNRKGRRISTF